MERSRCPIINGIRRFSYIRSPFWLNFNKNVALAILRYQERRGKFKYSADRWFSTRLRSSDQFSWENCIKIKSRISHHAIRSDFKLIFIELVSRGLVFRVRKFAAKTNVFETSPTLSSIGLTLHYTRMVRREREKENGIEIFLYTRH